MLESLEPKIVWDIFENIFCNTPHPSNHEEKIRARIKEWVAEHELEIAEDSAGNLLIKKGATPGNEDWQSILLQGHMDMVCETSRAEGFDFMNNPIPVRIDPDGEWVSADGTTLGADDGIGTSMALAVLIEDDPGFVHGPIEVLVTFAEETSLDGAENLDPDMLGIGSQYMINIDSEELALITIGSAGGGSMHLNTGFTYDDRDENASLVFHELSVSGLRGGHSGVDIHLPRASANKMLARVLAAINERLPVYLHTWNGGTRTNVIPRDGKVQFAVNQEDELALKEIVSAEIEALESYYKAHDQHDEVLEPGMNITFDQIDPVLCMGATKSEEIIRMVTALPHGPVKFAPAIPSLVETSNNISIVKIDPDACIVDVLLYPRSNLDVELEAFRRRLACIGKLASWNVQLEDPYPAWTPDPGSEFLKFVKKKYEEILGMPVNIAAVHAGLECSVIAKKIPALGTKILSFGSQVENAHSPAERARIKDVVVLFSLLKSVLVSIIELP
ncbi:MAG TPA: beta-Ala-His dipeptidase [Candidatus Lokiarchaeia archaeon]|nr:beta-Ala-His dipeptidase [Candidatus Lokiarchaeia archaeon]